MNCPTCQADSRVIASKNAAAGSVVRRTRQCCADKAHRWHTFETIDSATSISVLRQVQKHGAPPEQLELREAQLKLDAIQQIIEGKLHV